jgi:tubulin polyglutamylase TTLL6/13
MQGCYVYENSPPEFPAIYQELGNSNQCRHKAARPVVFNVADTQYEVVERVGEEMGWKVQYSDSKNWDLKWNDCAVAVDQVSKMSVSQKINHFPGMITLHRKNNLAKNLYRMQELDPDSYNFFPITFMLPSDFLRLRSYFQ